MKKIIKALTFLTILCIIWQQVFSILWIRKTSISYFYEEPKNSLDVIYIGASNAYVHFNTVLAYNQYGFTTGMLSTDAQPFTLVKYLIAEAQKYQTPKVYVVDLVKLAENFDEMLEDGIRKNIDTMRFTKNRIDAINELLNYKNADKSEYINYYLSFLLYHNKWKSITSFSNEGYSLYKGYVLTSNTATISPQDTYYWTDDIQKIPEENRIVLTNLIDYIKSKDLKVIFVIPGRTFTYENAVLNDITNILKENGLEVINFNTLNDFNIDFSTDLYNKAHLNAYGAIKYTLYFSKYLKENYDLPDHRNDERYNSWESEYERYAQDFKQLTNKNVDDVLLEYKNIFT